MTRIFVLGMMAPRIVGAMGWRFFWATEQIYGRDISQEVRMANPYRFWDADVLYPQTERIVAVAEKKPASKGLWIVSDNVHEDIANKCLFLKGSRNFGEEPQKQNPPGSHAKSVATMQLLKSRTVVISEKKQKGKKQRA